MVSAQQSCGQNRGRTPKLGSIHQLVPLSVPTASLLRGFGHAWLSPGLLGCLAARLVCAQIQTPRQIHRAANPTAWGSQERQIQGLRGKVWYLCIENKEKIALIGVINPWKKTYQELLCVLYHPPFFFNQYCMLCPHSAGTSAKPRALFHSRDQVCWAPRFIEDHWSSHEGPGNGSSPDLSIKRNCAVMCNK